MVGFFLIHDFVAKTQKITNLDELQQAFSEGIELLGFDKHTCMSLVNINRPPANAIWLYSFPEKWLDKSVERKQIFSEATEFDIKNGMPVPLNPPGHCTCHINMADDNLNIDTANYQSLHLMAVTYHHNAIKIMHLSDKLFQPPKLSPREKECLIWAAKGLSDHDIGDLLSLSSSTVTSYMKNVRDKFKVRTRIQAVVIAVSCGIILP